MVEKSSPAARHAGVQLSRQACVALSEPRFSVVAMRPMIGERAGRPGMPAPRPRSGGADDVHGAAGVGVEAQLPARRRRVGHERPASRGLVVARRDVEAAAGGALAPLARHRRRRCVGERRRADDDRGDARRPCAPAGPTGPCGPAGPAGPAEPADPASPRPLRQDRRTLADLQGPGHLPACGTSRSDEALGVLVHPAGPAARSPLGPAAPVRRQRLRSCRAAAPAGPGSPCDLDSLRPLPPPSAPLRPTGPVGPAAGDQSPAEPGETRSTLRAGGPGSSLGAARGQATGSSPGLHSVSRSFRSRLDFASCTVSTQP